MTNLTCTTSNCEHNVKSKCTAGVVSIAENGKCLSKVKREGGILAQTFADVEASEEFGAMETNECSIQCSSGGCKFNQNNICTCNNIEVGDGITGTKCHSRNLN